MKIHGLQKMTLLDFPGRVACTVFLGGCDLRCPFCHNFELVDGSAPPVMDDAQLLAFLEKRRGLLDGVAITGGEPTLRPDLPDLIRSIRALGYAVKLDTNGTHPGVLSSLLEENLLDYAAMDVKNTQEKYALTAGLASFDLSAVRESLALLRSHQTEYELRTTVVDELHEPEDFHGIGELAAGAPRFFLQAFTDRDSVPYGNFHAPSREKMEACAQVLRQYVAEVQLRGVDL